MARFAGLLETAIANADTRNQLTTSRVRLVTVGDEARRRLARDLHDGAQQTRGSGAPISTVTDSWA
jgi:signal transduction histidine kinase